MSVMETTYVSITNHTNQPTTPTPPDDYLSIRITASYDVPRLVWTSSRPRDFAFVQ